MNTKINNLKSSRYGANILITYTKQSGIKTPSFITGQQMTTAIEELPASYILVDFSGQIVTPEFTGTTTTQTTVATETSYSFPSDDIKTLNDGNLVWTYIDPNKNNLKLFILKTNTQLTKETLETKSYIVTPMNTKSENTNQRTSVDKGLKCEGGSAVSNWLVYRFLAMIIIVMLII